MPRSSLTKGTEWGGKREPVGGKEKEVKPRGMRNPSVKGKERQGGLDPATESCYSTNVNPAPLQILWLGRRTAVLLEQGKSNAPPCPEEEEKDDKQEEFIASAVPALLVRWMEGWIVVVGV